MVTPTQRSLALLRAAGYRVALVEHWNYHAKLRQDLFGIIDLLAVKPGETLAVQCTSYSNVPARVTKIAEAEATPDLRAAGWRIHVHGWRKEPGGHWTPRIVDCS